MTPFAAPPAAALEELEVFEDAPQVPVPQEIPEEEPILWCPEFESSAADEGPYIGFNGKVIPVKAFYRHPANRNFNPDELVTYEQPNGNEVQTTAYSARVGRFLQWAHANGIQVVPISGSTGNVFRFREDRVNQMQGLETTVIAEWQALEPLARFETHGKNGEPVPTSIYVPGCATIGAINKLIKAKYGPEYRVKFDVTTRDTSSVAANWVSSALGYDRDGLPVEAATTFDGNGQYRHITDPQELDDQRGTHGLATMVTELRLKIERVPPHEELIEFPLVGDDHAAYLRNAAALIAEFAPEMHGRDPDDLWVDGADLLDRTGMRTIQRVIEANIRKGKPSAGPADFRKIAIYGKAVLKEQELKTAGAQAVTMLHIRHHSETPMATIIERLYSIMVLGPMSLSEIRQQILHPKEPRPLVDESAGIEAMTEAYLASTKNHEHVFGMFKLLEGCEREALLAIRLLETLYRQIHGRDMPKTIGGDEIEKFVFHPALELLRPHHEENEIQAVDALREAVPELGRNEGMREGNVSQSWDGDVVIRLIDIEGREAIENIQHDIYAAYQLVMEIFVDAFHEAMCAGLDGFWNGHKLALSRQQTNPKIDPLSNGGMNMHIRITGKETEGAEAIIQDIFERVHKRLSAIDGLEFGEHVVIEAQEGEKRYCKDKPAQERVQRNHPEMLERRYELMVGRGGKTLFWFRQDPVVQAIMAEDGRPEWQYMTALDQPGANTGPMVTALTRA